MKLRELFFLLCFVLKIGDTFAQPCTALNNANPKLVPDPSQASYCLGSTVSFSINTTFGLMVGTMVWSFSGSANNIITSPNFYKLDDLVSPGIVAVSGIVNVGGTNCPFTRTINVTMSLLANAGPNMAISQGQPQVTIGGSPASGSGGNPPLSYSWSGPSFVGSSSVSNPTANPTSGGTYNLTVTDATGCSESDDMDVIYTYCYGDLKRTMDGGYYQVNNGRLYFSWKGEYNSSTQLKYKIYDDARGIRADYSTTAPSLAVSNGDNRYFLNLTASPLNFTSGDNNKFFTLEIFNEKNELFLMKFKYAQ